MKKSQIAASLALASTLSLAGVATPLVYAVELDNQPVVSIEAIAKTWDDVLDLMTSLDMGNWSDAREYNTYANTFEQNQAIIEAGTSDDNEAAMNALVDAYFGKDITSSYYGLTDYLATKSTTGAELKNAAEFYDYFTNNGLHDGDFDNAAIDRVLNFTIEHVGKTALQDNLTLLGALDLDHRDAWTTADYTSAAAVACMTLGDGPLTVNSQAISIDTAVDGFATYEEAKPYYTAEAAQENFAKDGGKVGNYYNYWMLEQELADLDLSDQDAVNDYYNRMAAAIEALQIPEKPGETPEEPVYHTVTLEASVEDDVTVTVAGEFAGTADELELVVSAAPVEIADFAEDRSAVYNIIVRDKATGETVNPKAGTKATVTIDLPSDFKADVDTEVHYIADDLQSHTQIEDATVADGKVTFTVEHFSLYALVQEIASVPLTPLTPATPIEPEHSEVLTPTDEETIVSPEAAVKPIVAPNTGVVVHSDRASLATAVVAGIVAATSAVIAAIAHFARRKA